MKTKKKKELECLRLITLGRENAYSLASKLEVDVRTVYRYIKRIRQAGWLIKKSGKGKNSYYICEQFLSSNGFSGHQK